MRQPPLAGMLTFEDKQATARFPTLFFEMEMVRPSASDATTLTARPEWAEAQRIVVKIGSALLTDRTTGRIKSAWLNSLMDDVAELAKAGKEIVLVSSGSIALGRHALNLPKGPLELEQSQAAAAVGQISLAHAYQELAAARGLTAAQVLLTLGDTEERQRYLNARNTIEVLLALKAIPVVNENDTVATAEIRYGDNDRLSARVASMVSADCLVLLSDIDGLYTAPPNDDPNAEHIPLVTEITPEIEAMAGDAGTELSKGGMRRLFEALYRVYEHSGFAMAGAIAFSFVVSIFPFCIFLGALSGIFGGRELAQDAINQLFAILPEPVAKGIAPQIEAVMGSQRIDLLTASAFLALFFATSAVETLRTALNGAYRVREKRPYALCLLISMNRAR